MNVLGLFGLASCISDICHGITCSGWLWFTENDELHGTYLNSILSPHPSLAEPRWDQLNPTLPANQWRRKINVCCYRPMRFEDCHAALFWNNSWLMHWHMDSLVKKWSAGESDRHRMVVLSPLEKDSDFSELECSIIFSPGRDCREHRLSMVCPLSAPSPLLGALFRVESW